MADETLDQHTEALREERGDRMRDAMIASIVDSGAENLEGAHGEVCFHFDDGMTMQIVFDCCRAGADLNHKGKPNV
jgi:hypothetical protein